MVMGTARYLSPEQASGGTATPASDIYSLGAVLYELLTGQPAFERPTPVATAMAHVNDPVQPIREVRPEVPSDLAALVERCLAKDPADRPGSAAEVAAALRAEAPVRAEAQTLVLPVPSSATLELPAPEPGATSGGPVAPAKPSARPRPAWLSRRTLVPAAVVAVLLAVILTVIALSGSDLTVQVPAFRGKSRAQASALATKLGLHAVFRGRTSSRRPGIVVNQHPKAGTQIAAGADVVLFVSRGAGTGGSASSSPAPSPAPQPSPPAHDHGHHEKPEPDRHHHRKPKPHGH